MNIDDVKAAHSSDYRVHTFKDVSHKENLRKELEQQIADFKGKIETIPAGKTRCLVDFEQMMYERAQEGLRIKNSRKKKH